MFSYVGYRSIDPTELEKLSTAEGVCWLDFLVRDGPTPEQEEKLERIRSILDDLPPVEADFIDLYYFRRKKQTDIAKMFGVSQPTVCYRLQRAADRLLFLLSLPPISEREIETAMRRFLSEEIDVQIMVHMFRTTCQSEVAKRLAVSQGLVRHRFMKAIEKMRDARMHTDGYRFKVFVPDTDDYEYTESFEGATKLRDRALVLIGDMTPDKKKQAKDPKIVTLPRINAKAGKYHDVFEQIAANLNILRDVRRKTPDDEIQRLVW